MKVTGPTGPSAPSAGRPAKAASGFSLGATGGSNAASGPAPAAAASGVADVSALMALQGVETPMERRRRAVRRGGGLLDRLDELKLDLLSGGVGEAALERLARAVREERPEGGDPGLEAVLDQIDLRVSVELAKAELRRQAG